MGNCDKLYIGFREFVDKDRLKDYDTDFFDKKRHTYKFMIPFIYKYVHLDDLKKKIIFKKNPELLYLFNINLNKFLIKEPKWVQESKLVQPTHNVKFLFRQSDY